MGPHILQIASPVGSHWYSYLILEHKGPGIYDEAYIDSLIKVIKIASGYGIKLFIGIQI